MSLECTLCCEDVPLFAKYYRLDKHRFTPCTSACTAGWGCQPDYITWCGECCEQQETETNETNFPTCGTCEDPLESAIAVHLATGHRFYCSDCFDNEREFAMGRDTNALSVFGVGNPHVG